MNDSSLERLRELARRIRIHALHMTSRGGGSHIGSVFSIADILAVLYGAVLRHRPEVPRWPERDRFLLSKGHAGAGVYAALAESGYFPSDWLAGHYQDGSLLSGHVSHKGIPGVEFSTGSLGHGLPVAAGMALAARLNRASHRVYTLMSDGECDEGSNWEAILFAGHHGLDNLVAIVDYNKLQSIRSTEETLGLEPFAAKWRAFRWTVHEVDGHDLSALATVLSPASLKPGRPTCILAHTTKGKGVSFMEDNVLWHYRAPRGEEFERALAELRSAP